jgi:hypothetical protein
MGSMVVLLGVGIQPTAEGTHLELPLPMCKGLSPVLAAESLYRVLMIPSGPVKHFLVLPRC